MVEHGDNKSVEHESAQQMFKSRTVTYITNRNVAAHTVSPDSHFEPGFEGFEGEKRQPCVLNILHRDVQVAGRYQRT